LTGAKGRRGTGRRKGTESNRKCFEAGGEEEQKGKGDGPRVGGAV